MTTGKTMTFTRLTFLGKVMSLVFNILSRFVICFFPRSKHLLIPWLQSLATLILEPRKMKSDTVSTFFISSCHEVIGLDAMIFMFECWRLSQHFHLLFSPLSRGSLVSLHFLPLKWFNLRIWDCWYFSRQSWLQLMSPPFLHFMWYTTMHVS